MTKQKIILSIRSRTFILISGLVFVLIIGLVDYKTGYELGFFLFYLLPIALVTWIGGLFLGIAIAVVSSMTWLTSDILTRLSYSSLIIPVWNTSIRLIVFLIVSYSLWKIRLYQKNYKELVEFIVHDLRNPLMTIIFGLENLQEISAETLNESQKETIDICAISSKRMSALVDSILDLSRLESGKMKIETGEVDVCKLADSLLEEVSIYAKKHDVKLEKHIDAQLCTIRTDHGLLVRILANLLSNAIKISPEGKTVYLAAREDGARNIEFSVKDEGPGIPKDITDLVFDKFTQLRARENGVIVGSGLGLSFCKLAVEALGGKIWIDSEAGKGTTVKFVLPTKIPQHYGKNT